MAWAGSSDTPASTCLLPPKVCIGAPLSCSTCYSPVLMEWRQRSGSLAELPPSPFLYPTALFQCITLSINSGLWVNSIRPLVATSRLSPRLLASTTSVPIRHTGPVPPAVPKLSQSWGGASGLKETHIPTYPVPVRASSVLLSGQVKRGRLGYLSCLPGP